MLGVDISGRFFAARISQQHNIHFLAVISGQSTCEMKWLRYRKHANNITQRSLTIDEEHFGGAAFLLNDFLGFVGLCWCLRSSSRWTHCNTNSREKWNENCVYQIQTKANQTWKTLFVWRLNGAVNVDSSGVQLLFSKIVVLLTFSLFFKFMNFSRRKTPTDKLFRIDFYLAG